MNGQIAPVDGRAFQGKIDTRFAPLRVQGVCRGCAGGAKRNAGIGGVFPLGVCSFFLHDGTIRGGSICCCRCRRHRRPGRASQGEKDARDSSSLQAMILEQTNGRPVTLSPPHPAREWNYSPPLCVFTLRIFLRAKMLGVRNVFPTLAKLRSDRAGFPSENQIFADLFDTFNLLKKRNVSNVAASPGNLGWLQGLDQVQLKSERYAFPR